MHDRVSVNAICFPGSGLPELAEQWGVLGCRRVSLTSQPILQEGVAAVQAVLQSGAYALETIAHVFVPGPLQADPAAWREPRERLGQVIEAAKALGARSIYMLTGGRGAMGWEEAAEVFAATVAPCLEQAKAAGVALAIENAPPVYADIHLAASLRDAATLAERAGLGVCFDLALGWTEADLKTTLARLASRLVLVQVSDYVYGDRAYPNRAVPGDGAIPLRTTFEWVLETGYDGAFDLELLGPRIDREGHLAATRRAAEVTSELLRGLGV